MTAFLDLLNAYAIWIYIAGVVGILFGIKMLADSRRLARTTLFTLEQEQATDKALRAILTMLVFMGLIAAVTAINYFIAPERPTASGVAVNPTALLFTPPVWLPTSTSVPTFTPAVSTSTPTVETAATRGAPNTVAPVSPPTSAPSRTPTPDSTPTAAPTVGLAYPAPSLIAPVPNDSKGVDRFQFLWGGDGIPQTLPAGQLFLLTVQYTDSSTKQPVGLVNCTPTDGIDTRFWPELADTRLKADGGKYSWSVVIIQQSKPDAGCSGSPMSPPSEVRSFTWR